MRDRNELDIHSLTLVEVAVVVVGRAAWQNRVEAVAWGHESERLQVPMRVERKRRSAFPHSAHCTTAAQGKPGKVTM